jgi:hypothetical protein
VREDARRIVNPAELTGCVPPFRAPSPAPGFLPRRAPLFSSGRPNWFFGLPYVAERWWVWPSSWWF